MPNRWQVLRIGPFGKNGPGKWNKTHLTKPKKDTYGLAAQTGLVVVSCLRAKEISAGHSVAVKLKDVCGIGTWSQTTLC